MIAASVQHFDSLCRTCMHDVTKMVPNVGGTTEEVEEQWRSIFDTIKECETLSIAELLSNTIPQMEVPLSDDLPKKICCHCTHQLVNVYRFQQMCLQTEQQIRALIAEKKLESKVFLPIDDKGHDVEVNLDDNLPEAQQSAHVATDPLESICEDIHHFKTAVQGVCDEFMKSEPFEDDPNSAYNDHEELAYKDDVTTEEMEVILEKSAHNCSICNESFNAAGLLKTHMIKQHKKNNVKQKNVPVPSTSPSKRIRLKCEICNRNFRKPETLQNHLMKHEKRTREKLPIPESFDDNDDPNFDHETLPSKEDVTAEEMEVILEKSAHNCSICNESFNAAGLLKTHMIKQHKKNNVKQKNVPVPTTSPSKRIRLKCEICNQDFGRPETLQNHLKKHEKGTREKLQTHACDMCDRKYKTAAVLKYHKKLRHSVGGTPVTYTCEFCKKITRNGLSTFAHEANDIRIHTGERPYLCPECGKAFSTESNLWQHRHRHTQDRIAECPYCPKKFRIGSDLSNHIKIHNAVKPHKCDSCSAAFFYAYELKKHIAWHNGEKPYKCEFCDKRFARQDSRHKHMRTHTGEKPYKCKYCDRAFSQSGDMVKHLRLHLGENVYRCELCPSAFRLSGELRTHFATHKNEDKETRERNLKALKEAEAKMQIKMP